MADDRAESQTFRELATELAADGLGFRFQAKGRSMLPTIRDGDMLHVRPLSAESIETADIVLFKDASGFKAHRVVKKHDGLFVTQGDSGAEPDGAIRGRQIVGKIVAKECSVTGRVVRLDDMKERMIFFAREVRRRTANYLRSQHSTAKQAALLIMLLLLPLSLRAQVTLDASTSAQAQLTSAANTLTFAHTSTGSNLVLVVGVSMNISADGSTTVSGITYNGVALTKAGAHDDSLKTRRTEMWYLINPATGANNVVVTVNVSAGNTIGTVAGATTYKGADQTSPIRTYASNDSGSVTSQNPHVDVASSINDMVLDTVAIDGKQHVTSASGTQVQQWALTSFPGTGSGNQDVYGYGSTRAGAPSVPMSENTSADVHWSDSAVSVEPLQADVRVSESGNTVQFPSNVIYTVTVTNGGPSASSGVVLTDTLASGLTLVSAVPSTGSCSGTTTITCNLGTLAVSGTATVTITATPAAPGGYVNSASVTATTTDLNMSNNSATTVAYSEFTACVNSTSTTNTNVNGVINSYYPGNATVSAGSTSITLGAATGAGTAIASGDLVLIIQMQDAAINSSNSASYGDGISGSGSTSLNNAGVYEYANATNAVPTTGGTLTVTAAGSGGGLLYTYTSAAASSTQGARTFQVIRVPNYSAATLSSTTPPTALAWNGATGGVLALDVSGVLTLNSTTINVSGLGFRGGAGLQLTGSATGAANTDYRYTAPTSYTGAAVAGADGPKGEGIAGTPEWVESSNTFLNTAQTYAEGYPLGSMARGAPGNAGGGGTDGDPTGASPNGNDQNSGGGGGANGGAGGQGGDTWTSNLTVGGLGGTAFPGSISRIVMGGGGGAATRNNDGGNNQASSGAAGGAIVMIRANSLSGTATIRADGAAAYNGTLNDGGGGGGAGGSVIVLWATGVGTGLTVSAQGGRGGDAWDAQGYSNANRHGPGGGGGGGVILLSGAAATATVAAGSNGFTLTPGVPYGATAGASGLVATNVSLNSSPGPHSASICTDVAITKTGSPEPVLQNATLTYTLSVTNNGPQTASGVTVVDTLPTQVTFSSATPSQGTCSQAAGVVTCNLGTINSGVTATITIVTTANTPSLALNTAVVNSTTPDPTLANNTATFTSTIEFPNAVRLGSFSVNQTRGGALLSWNSGGELHNLGFNVYRDVGGEKVRLNPSLIAGSALLMREALEQHGARTYGWIDRSSNAGGLYWLEDVDLNGTRTMHGPVSVQVGASAPAAITPVVTMQDLTRGNSVSTGSNAPASGIAHVRESVARPRTSSAAQAVGFQLASQQAVKIFVDHEGWYHISQPQLVAAGLNPNVEARSLSLFAEGVEQPIRIAGATLGFGPQAAIEFYGTAIDTPYTGQRVYWLVANGQPGTRIVSDSGIGSAGPQPRSFIQTLELKPRSTYFAALLHDNTDNFFGPLVSPTPAVQTVNVANLAAGEGMFEIALQGVTQGQQHDVTVTLNNATLGSVNFADQQEGKARFAIPAGLLINGTNTITLTAQQGDNDLSVLDYINVSFPHTFTAESDFLKFTAAASESVQVGGFVHPPSHLIDVTDAAQPFEITFRTTTENGLYALETNIPWTSAGRHQLMALSDAQLAVPVAMTLHRPSNLHTPQPGAEAVMLAAPEFISQVQPLAELRRAEGKLVAVVNVDDIYDEFNFGERTPYAIRNFLRTATVAWKNKPHYLLLGGDASFDARNYLGFGFFDFVPTKVVITSELKTASDDWFSDFSNTGFATIATGRLPARTTADMQTMVGKILSYAGGQAGTWTNQAMMVADLDDPSVNFSQAALSVQKMLPQTMNVSDVFASTLGPGTARQDLLAGINAGQLLVNYNGHGSVEIWGNGLFNDTLAGSLNNGTKLPVFVAMNCLNGFFHDVYTQSLAEALMLAPNGGAVSVWASSGLTAPDPQFQTDRVLVKTLFSQPSISLGDAVLVSKSGIGDADVRKTFILFGDPLMRLKQQTVAPQMSIPKPISSGYPVRTPRGAGQRD